jgi:phenylacetate-CoA ligase
VNNEIRYRHPEVECLPLERLRALQAERMRNQIRYLWERSRLYRKKFDDAGLLPGDIKTLEDFRKIPFTTKDELRQSIAEEPPYGRHCCVPREEVAWAPSTSGTSGVPLVLPRSQRDIEIWIELNARAFTTMGLRPGDILQNIMGYQWLYAGIMLHLGAQRAGAAVVNAGMGNSERQMWALEHFQPDVLLATPSYFTYLGNLVAERELTRTLRGPRIATGGGEVGCNTPAGKQAIRSRFPAVQTVSDIGGVTDIGTIIWVECPYETGGHFSEDSIYAEVLDPETFQPVAEGQPGELVMSDFVDTCTPLIRYRVKDLVTWTSAACPCGRTLGRMPEGVIGRVDDMITVRSANIYPSAIDAIVKGMPELNGEYQIVVDRPKGLDELTIRVEPADATVNPAEIIHAVQTRMRLNSATAVTVEVVAAGSLPRFVYKASRVVDKRKGQTEHMMFEKAAAQGRS